jgi:hypothetical protein
LKIGLSVSIKDSGPCMRERERVQEAWARSMQIVLWHGPVDRWERAEVVPKLREETDNATIKCVLDSSSFMYSLSLSLCEYVQGSS